MKKLFALLLSVIMVLSMFAGCGGETTEPTETEPEVIETEPTETEPEVVETEPVVAEELPEAKYYWSFEDATGITAVTQVEKAADSINDGATYDIGPSDRQILFSNGPVGQCVYLDGKYGIQLNDLASIDTDAYTISFWMNADRLSTYGPVVQMGRNMGDSADPATDSYRTCTWVNFTKTEWGTSSADIFPVVWNRNSDTTVWPWVYAADDSVHGKREWVLVTLVSSGEKYTYAEDGLERVGCKLYLNGELKFDASADLGLYGGLSPEILTGDGVEGYIGINYWDTIFKGYIDELYVFDCALTDGQVLSLFQAGDVNVESIAPEIPEDGAVEETEPAPLAAAPVDAAAIDVMGTPERVLGWWSDNTAGYELADGATVTMKLNNYSDGVNNWDNFVIGLVNTAVTTDVLPSADNYAGYAEYAIIRADAFGWGDASYAASFTTSWTDWAAWLQLMTDADVTLVLTRNGGEVTIDFTFVGADGTTMTEQAVVTSTMTAESPVYVFLGGEGAYIELLSVE